MPLPPSQWSRLPNSTIPLPASFWPHPDTAHRSPSNSCPISLIRPRAGRHSTRPTCARLPCALGTLALRTLPRTYLGTEPIMQFQFVPRCSIRCRCSYRSRCGWDDSQVWQRLCSQREGRSERRWRRVLGAGSGDAL